MNDPYNEPAFPIPGGLHEHQFAGMTLRDYFAAKAMASIMTSAVVPEEAWAEGFAMIARGSYAVADAMLKAREA